MVGSLRVCYLRYHVCCVIFPGRVGARQDDLLGFNQRQVTYALQSDDGGWRPCAAVTPIAALTGMVAEASLLNIPVACSGGDALRAEQLARRMLEQGAEVLLSFGVAGGLIDAPPGQLIIGDSVVYDGEIYPCDPMPLCEALPNAMVGPVAGVTKPVMTVADKRSLHGIGETLCVDMESAAVARVCAEFDRSFLILRAIADPVDRAIPSLALKGLDARGRTRPGRILLGLLGQPFALPGLMRLARDNRAALSALAGATATLGLKAD